jgi:general secretion pathway protein J
VLFGGLRFGARAWDGAQAHGTGTDELRVVQGLLRREIEQAYPYYDTTDPIHPVADFRGGADWMSFLAPAPQSLDSNGRDRIVISGEAGQLMMQMAPELATARRGDGPSSLLRNVASVRFFYLGADGWSGRWANEQMLPRLVRVHIAFRRGDGRIWPDLIVAPRIEADAGCVFDANTKHCQGRL